MVIVWFENSLRGKEGTQFSDFLSILEASELRTSQICSAEMTRPIGVAMGFYNKTNVAVRVGRKNRHMIFCKPLVYTAD